VCNLEDKLITREFSFELKSISYIHKFDKSLPIKDCLILYKRIIEKKKIFENILKENVLFEINRPYNKPYRDFLMDHFYEIVRNIKDLYEFDIDKEIIKSCWVSEDKYYSEYEIHDLCNKNGWLFERNDSETIITYNLEGDLQKEFKFKVENYYTIKGYWHRMKNYSVELQYQMNL
jgi:hypothetical protein